MIVASIGTGIRRVLLHRLINKRHFHQAWPALSNEIKNGRQSLDILFLVTAHNTMSQKAYCLLSSLHQHRVMVELHSNEKLVERVRALKPHLIICPFLTRAIPNEIYDEFITLIVHPGPVGDRGPHSVDRWVLERPKEWGITILQAVEKLDAGPVWAEEKIDTEQHLSPTATKSDAYNLLTSITMKAMKRMIDQILTGINPAVEQPGKCSYINQYNASERTFIYSEILNNRPLNNLKQGDCAINWSLDSPETIARKIQSRDSQPGLLDSINGKSVHLYGARVQPLSIPCATATTPKTLLSYDKGAFLLSTKDPYNALWITHLKNPADKQKPFKLPAAMVLPPNNLLSKKYPSFQDVWTHIEGDVCYVHWEFYNGAMRDDHCHRLKYALECKKKHPFKVLVLLGGQRYFSNGIDLNTIEASQNPVQQSHLYINAINDLIQYLMTQMSDKIIIAALQGHAGAGGAMLSQVADYVFIHENSIVNPHYKTMGLYGSEYWTFNLSARLGSFSQAQLLTDSLRPLNHTQAVACGFANDSFSSITEIENKITNDILPNFSELLKEKTMKRDENISKYGHPEECRERELKVMYENFRSLDYQHARSQFVRKLPSTTTPLHLLQLGRSQATLMSGIQCATNVLQQIRAQYSQNYQKDIPTLACILVGENRESQLYVKMKERTLKEQLNFQTNIYHFPSSNTQISHLKELINSLNDDSSTHGILVQLPLPDYLRDEQNNILKLIDPRKDVDGLLYPHSPFVPCTPQGILWLLDWYNVKLAGKNVVVVGASKLVGEPVGLLCKSRGATVTYCSIQSRNLRDYFEHADVIISATGQPHLIHGDHLPTKKQPLVIVDAGVSSKPPIIRGDVHMESVRNKCTLLTPSTGGVGKMTIAALAYNLFNAYNLSSVYGQQSFQQPMNQNQEKKQDVFNKNIIKTL